MEPRSRLDVTSAVLNKEVLSVALQGAEKPGEGGRSARSGDIMLGAIN